MLPVEIPIISELQIKSTRVRSYWTSGVWPNCVSTSGLLAAGRTKSYTSGVIAALALSAALLAPAHADVSLSTAAPASVTAPTAAPAAAPARGPALRLLSDDELPDFRETFKSRASLAKAAKRTLAYLESDGAPRYIHVANRTYAAGALVDSLEEVIRLARTAKTSGEFADAIKRDFDVFQSVGGDGAGKVIFSSYYEPVLAASRRRTPRYGVPIYKRPRDLVEVDLGAFDPKYGDKTLVGRLDKTGRVLPYFTRADIDIKKSLSGQGLELAWLQDKLDVLDLHIQGSGILRFPGGQQALARYAGTNARGFNAVGLLLVKAGIMTRDGITREKIHDYLKEHPGAADWILSQDPRYTFFELLPLPEGGEPKGALEQPLVPARSVAVDPSAVPLGALVYFATTSPQADDKGRLLGQFPNSRFAVAMDTGGAIKGPGRVDIYAGHGAQAETTARGQWAEGKLYVLIKKLPPRDR